MFDDTASEPSNPMSADDLADSLKVAVQCDMADWLVEAVVEAVTNDDLSFLIRQVERHVPGWTQP